MKNIKSLLNKPYMHRGIFNNKDVPENSIKAFKLALDKEYNIELDVHLTKDYEIVVFHDYNLMRMCGIDKNIEECTYLQLQEYCLLSTKYKIPRLKEVLDLVNGKVNILIETKVKKYDSKLEQELSKLLDNYSGSFLIQSFNLLSINWFKKNKKDYIIGVLASNFKSKKVNKIYKYISKTCLFDLLLNVDFISYDIRGIPNKYIENKRKLKPIFAWTIRNEVDKSKAKKYCDVQICQFDNI